MAVRQAKYGQPAVYNASAPTLNDGDSSALAVDANQNQYTRESYGPTAEDNINGVMKVEQRGTIVYHATAGADKVVSPTPAFLYGMIIGADVASATLEVSDHASDGDGNVKILLTGSTLMTSTGGYVPVNAHFPTGIAADQTSQTNVTYIIRADA